MPTPDFSKIWASASPLPEYTFSDADYVEGWECVGNAPPTKNQFDAWFKYTDERLQWLYQKLMTSLYPVGSVYISFDATDPSTLFGGTWVRLKDAFLLASGDAYPANTTGGSATKTISTSNLPAHNHTVNAAGEHTHTRGTMNIKGDIEARSYKAVTGHAEPSAFYALSGVHMGFGTNGDGYFSSVGFDASRSWSGATSSDGLHTHTTNNTGNGLPLNIMPPYQTVYMWKRTA